MQALGYHNICYEYMIINSLIIALKNCTYYVIRFSNFCNALLNSICVQANYLIAKIYKPFMCKYTISF